MEWRKIKKNLNHFLLLHLDSFRWGLQTLIQITFPHWPSKRV
jgi:hypothetical protein